MRAIRFNPLPLGEGAVVNELASRTTAGEGNKTISRIGPISLISWISPLRSLRSDKKFSSPIGEENNLSTIQPLNRSTP